MENAVDNVRKRPRTEDEEDGGAAKQLYEVVFTCLNLSLGSDGVPALGVVDYDYTHKRISAFSSVDSPLVLTPNLAVAVFDWPKMRSTRYAAGHDLSEAQAWRCSGVHASELVRMILPRSSTIRAIGDGPRRSAYFGLYGVASNGIITFGSCVSEDGAKPFAQLLYMVSAASNWVSIMTSDMYRIRAETEDGRALYLISPSRTKTINGRGILLMRWTAELAYHAKDSVETDIPYDTGLFGFKLNLAVPSFWAHPMVFAPEVSSSSSSRSSQDAAGIWFPPSYVDCTKAVEMALEITTREDKLPKSFSFYAFKPVLTDGNMNSVPFPDTEYPIRD